MACRLPKLTLATLLWAASSLAAAEPAPEGNTLVATAAQTLLRQPAFEAKLRQRASLFGQRVAGAGLYVQGTTGEHPLVRFEFKLQVADRTFSVLHVNDGAILWIRRDVDQQSSQAYVNLRRVREANSGRSNGARPPVGAEQLAIGGLGQLLQQLSQRFEFAPPVAAEFQGVPVWEVSGRWSEAERTRLLGDVGILPTPDPPWHKLPEHLPTTVKLTLGRDQNFPLFPYRIEFGRLTKQAAVPGGEAKEVVQPLVTMELFEVRRRPDLTQEFFKFPIGDEAVEDQTDKYIW